MNYLLKSIFIGVILVATQQVYAQKAKSLATTTFQVEGICGMCKERIENAANIRGVKKAEWDVESGVMTLVYRIDRTSPEDVMKSIAEAGHDSEKVTATDEAYGKVHGCCKYRTDVKH